MPVATASPRPGVSPVRPDPTTELARTPSEQALIENPRLWMAVALGIALVAGLGFLLRQLRITRRERRRREEEERRPQVTVAGVAASTTPSHGDTVSTDGPAFWTPSHPIAPSAAPIPSMQAEVVPPPPRPRVTFTLRARRTGLNLVSATADIELTVRNEGDAVAEAITVGLQLLAGRASQDDELTALFRAEPSKPAVPPFALEPGDERLVRTTLVLPRAGIEPILVKDRPMFVPVVVADIRYARPDGGQGQSAAAFVIGALRAGGNKLSPFWLDTPPKMRDEVEARPHGTAIEI